MEINNKDISVVIQGAVDRELTETAIKSIRAYLPGATIIISTWKGEEVSSLDVDELVLNEDPGCSPRSSISKKPKMNNVNRQIVSSLNGLKSSKTKFSLKMRTDFIVTGKGFVEAFGKYNDYNSEKYKVFSSRIICCMVGTRKPVGVNYSLPFHVSDFSAFGLTEDLLKLYDIPLATEDEFKFFDNHPEIERKTFATNRYNAEQTIWVNCLRSNNKLVDLDHSTHLSNENVIESDRFLVNNFHPLSFKKYGVSPIKCELKRMFSNPKIYTDYYTEHEWMMLYKKHCSENVDIPLLDLERLLIKLKCKMSRKKV
jgi:hypothetical protein